jgi:type II secretory pathway pseudopilin PulG
MTKNPLKSSAGFTYVAAIVMVVIMGIMLSQAAQYWTMRMQREREVELLYKGTQVRDAMRAWYGGKASGGTWTPPATGTTQRPNLTELKTLLNGTDSAAKTHFLRPSNMKVKDPITGKELDWELFKDAGSPKVIGVYIKSNGVPIKQDNFQFDLHPDDFRAKKKYSEWVFIYNRVPPSGPSGGIKLPGATSVTGAPGSSPQP